jgi:DNA polymerase I-like protein with 3'-5' exonuclease and polymerase domains
MKEYLFLSYLVNPYNPNDACFCVQSLMGNEPQEISLEELCKFEEKIVTYNLPLLVEALRVRGLPIPANILDVEQAGRLIIGHSHTDYTGQLPWLIWSLLEDYLTNKALLDTVKNWHYRTVPIPDASTIISSLVEINKIIISLWIHQLAELDNLGELNRFMRIELPVNTLLLSSQYKGIKIDSSKLHARLDKLDEIVVSNTEELRKKWGLLDVSNTKALCDSLNYLGYTNLSNIIDAKEQNIFFTDQDTDIFFNLTADWIELLRLYHGLKKAERDKNILLRFGAIGEERIYPIFEGIGTITGRVLVKSPAIQHLKKSSRDIITADDGYILLYPDFNQFEPGILADDSRDQNLSTLYNSGDVYDALSAVLFNSKEPRNRKTAKRLFLAYSYGMSEIRIGQLISELTNQDIIVSQQLVNNFFGQFPEIPKWKEYLCEMLFKNGRIGTRDGNYRYRKNTHKGNLTDVEKRWVISQRIQGTASLILKKCILRISKEIPEAEFLIPMHDAVLYQVPNDLFTIAKRHIEEIFIDEYKQECKSILPKISFNPFWEDENVV